MINSKDLRIGNYLRIKESDTVIQVEPYMLSVSELINYAPVVLSPEILEKCGFEFEDNEYTRYGWYKRLNEDFWIVRYKTEFIGIEDNDSNVLIEVPCAYVHQLQNLYLALTGEELEFKP